MSLLLNQPTKLCFRKPVFVRSSPLLCNNGFSTSLTQTPPCSIIFAEPCGANRGKLVISRAGDMAEMETIGSSNGWLATLKDGVVGLKPFESDTDPKRIWLPPLVTLPHCQTQMVTNVAMSSPFPEEEDCVVAVKFLGPQISFCRPAQSNSEWINIRIGNPCFFSSPVMFSMRDDMFHVPGSGGHLIGSWDLRTQTHTPKFRRLRFRRIPNLTKAIKELLDSCYKSEHLVESETTHETFLVKQYKKTAKIIDGIARMKTEALMVFKLDGQGNAFYTKDIGDLCIFLTKSETFCVSSSSFPDEVFPNHVQIVDVDETASVNLADQRWNCLSQRPLL